MMKRVVLKLRPLAECSKSPFDHLLSKMGVVETPTPGGKRWLEEIGFPHKLGKDNYLSDLGIATCCDGHLPEYIPENIFYRLAMKANSPVDPEDKDRRQITTQFGSKGVVKHGTPSGEQEMVIINESGLYNLILMR